MKTSVLPARHSGRRCLLPEARRQRGRSAVMTLVLALVLAPAVLSALASAAIAQNVTFSLQLTYSCNAPTAGCDQLTEQRTFTTLQAPASGPINLTQENGGKGVLSTFWMIGKRDSSDFTIACADGSDLIFDTSKLFKVNTAGYFSCGKVTIAGTDLNFTLDPAADGQGPLNGSANKGWVRGRFRFMARGIDTLISQEYVTLTLPKIAIQNKWDSCVFSGYEDVTPVHVPVTGCLLHPGQNDNNPWTLETLFPGGLDKCHAVCMSRLPD
jgi:hypothetical protein